MHSPEDVVTVYTDGLGPTVRTIVQRYRESHRRAIYLELVQNAKSEEEAVFAKGVQPVVGGAKPVGNVEPVRRTANLLQSSSESGKTATMDGQREEETSGYLGRRPQDMGIPYSSTYMTAT